MATVIGGHESNYYQTFEQYYGEMAKFHEEQAEWWLKNTEFVGARPPRRAFDKANEAWAKCVFAALSNMMGQPIFTDNLAT